MTGVVWALLPVLSLLGSVAAEQKPLVSSQIRGLDPAREYLGNQLGPKVLSDLQYTTGMNLSMVNSIA
jgi:hypothetical protein